MTTPYVKILFEVQGTTSLVPAQKVSSSELVKLTSALYYMPYFHVPSPCMARMASDPRYVEVDSFKTLVFQNESCGAARIQIYYTHLLICPRDQSLGPP